jgi:hypothetical protein
VFFKDLFNYVKAPISYMYDLFGINFILESLEMKFHAVSRSFYIIRFNFVSNEFYTSDITSPCVNMCVCVYRATY